MNAAARPTLRGSFEVLRRGKPPLLKTQGQGQGPRKQSL